MELDTPCPVGVQKHHERRGCPDARGMFMVCCASARLGLYVQRRVRWARAGLTVVSSEVFGAHSL